MIKDKFSSATTFVKEHKVEIGFAAFSAGIIGLAVKYPEAFEVEEKIPTMKIIHVHVNQ